MLIIYRVRLTFDVKKRVRGTRKRTGFFGDDFFFRIIFNEHVLIIMSPSNNVQYKTSIEILLHYKMEIRTKIEFYTTRVYLNNSNY